MINEYNSSVESDAEITIVNQNKPEIKASIKINSKNVPLKAGNNKNNKSVLSNNGVASNRHRRRSRVEQIEELKTMKDDGVSQYENLVKMLESLNSQTQQISQLQNENNQMKQNLHETTEMNKELQNQNNDLISHIQQLQQQTVMKQMEKESIITKANVNNLWQLSNDKISTNQYIQDLLQIKHNLEAKLTELEEKLNLKDYELDELKILLNEAQSSSGEIKEKRTKSELLERIRESMADKVVWQEYACELTRNVVSRAPELLCINHKQLVGTGNSQDEEKRWANFGRDIIKYLERHDVVDARYLEGLLNNK